MYIFLLASDLAIGVARTVIWGAVSLFFLGIFLYWWFTRSKEKDDIPDDV